MKWQNQKKKFRSSECGLEGNMWIYMWCLSCFVMFPGVSEEMKKAKFNCLKGHLGGLKLFEFFEQT